ncbi:hypothetical protein AC579_5845 [Pseudocercospora musae]|uniref:Uncharacterized protein n=1 Tax=Pseudocercospora musae TaxID=113226 RepID=A0A139ILH8_9PEZI|nr:hypothetical protein AC579_5845 [Pseudocercospora musae]
MYRKIVNHLTEDLEDDDDCRTAVRSSQRAFQAATTLFLAARTLNRYIKAIETELNRSGLKWGVSTQAPRSVQDYVRHLDQVYAREGCLRVIRLVGDVELLHAHYYAVLHFTNPVTFIEFSSSCSFCSSFV